MPSHEYLYITKVVFDSHPFIKQQNIQIESKDSKKRNIIITGRNGCGKSTLLNLIKSHILAFSFNRANNQAHYHRIYTNASRELAETPKTAPKYKSVQQRHAQALQNCVNNAGFVDVTFSDQSLFNNKNNALAYFEAKRLTDLSKPQNITAPELTERQIGDHNAGKEFIHHLVNRRSQLAFANEDGDTEEAESIRIWFQKLDQLFSRLFQQPVQLTFLRTQLDFILETEDGQVIDLKTLSDGYSAIVNMVTEIIMRMETVQFGGLDIGGIVLIDEVETHLHVALQREVLPFLTAMFPNIQFIVTTHSPFVLQSVDDALIYDLESNQVIDQAEELWKYSYEALVDGYFEVDKFSGILRDKILRYKELSSAEELERSEKKELRQLKKELESVPTFKNAAIETELKQLGLK
ncbi:AAA family ATPase [Vibrio coralliirubri]|uniref:AAA family ATPase n=1 Tax=Vibrio coralliirubri TaxID=1516159 RepID=UPI002FD2528C